MVLSADEESLVKAIRALGPEEAHKWVTWANELAEPAKGREIEWSDCRSDEDGADATIASVSSLEQREGGSLGIEP
jgi:hypothetical protein